MKKSQLRQIIKEELSKLNESKIDTLNPERIKEVGNIIRSIISNDREMSFKKIYDPEQTHAIYGVSRSMLPWLESQLLKRGASEFRKTPLSPHLYILAFNAENIN